MKYIKVIDPIDVNIEGKEAKLDCFLLYQYLIDSDKVFNSESLGIRSSIRIDTELKRVKKDNVKYIALEDEDHKRLKAASENPSHGYPLTPARRLQPFITAIAEAVETNPDVEKINESN